MGKRFYKGWGDAVGWLYTTSRPPSTSSPLSQTNHSSSATLDTLRPCCDCVQSLISHQYSTSSVSHFTPLGLRGSVVQPLGSALPFPTAAHSCSSLFLTNSSLC